MIGTLLPTVVALVVLAHVLFGKVRPETGILAAVLAAAGHLLPVVLRGVKSGPPCVGRCAWIALGEGYLRLGMSFLRPRILFEQLADLQRGEWARGRWTASSAGSRMKLRFVMARSWEAVAVAYPLSIDPTGELTTQLQAAAARNREHLCLREGAPDAEVTQAYRELEARLRAARGTTATADDPWEEAEESPPEVPTTATPPRWPRGSESPPAPGCSPSR